VFWSTQLYQKKGGHCFFIRKNSETLTNKTFESIDI
jgi:hypothetical protein